MLGCEMLKVLVKFMFSGMWCRCRLLGLGCLMVSYSFMFLLGCRCSIRWLCVSGLVVGLKMECGIVLNVIIILEMCLGKCLLVCR